MDRFKQINRILDACLTTGLIDQVYPSPAFQKDLTLALPEKRARHRLAQIKILEKAGSIVQTQLGKNLEGEDLVLFCQRVDEFLMTHGFEIRNVF